MFQKAVFLHDGYPPQLGGPHAVGSVSGQSVANARSHLDLFALLYDHHLMGAGGGRIQVRRSAA